MKRILFFALFTTLFLSKCGTLCDKSEKCQTGIKNISAPIIFVKSSNNNLKVSGKYLHSFVLRNDNTLYATGRNDLGQLGLGNEDRISVYTFSLSNVSDVCTGFNHSLALKQDGSLWGTGSNDSFQLGISDKSASNTWIKLLDNVKKIYCGFDFSLIIKNDNTLWGAGPNLYIGSGGDTIQNQTWTQVATDIVKVSAGRSYSFALRSDNVLLATGKNDDLHKQFGIASPALSFNWIEVLTDVKDMFASGHYSPGPGFAVRTDNSIWSTKSKYWALFYSNEETLSKISVSRNSNLLLLTNGKKLLSLNIDTNEMKVINDTVIDFDSSEDFYGGLFYLKDDHSMWVKGENEYGELGLGTTTYTYDCVEPDSSTCSFQ